MTIFVCEISKNGISRSVAHTFAPGPVRINRVVTLLDPTTRREVRVPISEYASSHMARRTFYGNVYKNVKDPSIGGSMSGHKEGSKAFARYREIDKDIKRDALKVFDAI